MAIYGARALFLGEFEHAVDERGRIAIPAKFRPGLADGMVVTRGFDHCLVIWPMEEWRLIAERLRLLPFMHADARRLQRLVLSGATDTVPDRLGRILIPAFLRAYAELEEVAVVVGVHDRVEVWSRAHWDQERATAEADSARLAEDIFNLGVQA